MDVEKPKIFQLVAKRIALVFFRLKIVKHNNFQGAISNFQRSGINESSAKRLSIYLLKNSFKTENWKLKIPSQISIIGLVIVTLIATLAPNNSIASSQVTISKTSTADFDLGTNNNLATTSDELKMTPNPRTAWYSTGGTWNYRKKVVIDHTKVPNTDQTDFPVLINLASDSDLASKAQDDGDDLLLTQEDQTTKLSHEIESFNGTTGALVLWVKIPLLSHTYDTTIYLYYGNAAATSQQSATAVWSNGYAGVWHMDETSGDFTDSSGNNKTGVNSGAISTESKIGLGVDGLNASIQLGASSSFNFADPWTVSFWMKQPALEHSDVLLKWSGSVDSPGRKVWFFDANNYFAYNSHGSGSVNGSKQLSSTWEYFSSKYEKGSSNIVTMYKNGIASSPVTQTQPSDVAGHITKLMPRRYLDEMRIQTVARSADWIATEYANQNDPGTFYSLQSETAKTSVNIASNNISTDWYHTDWKYRRQITIDHTKVPNTDQSEFPMLVKIADSTDPIFTKAQADGDDILFTNTYGNTKLSHEIETFNTTTKELWAWVKIPALSTSTDTKIWLYYGNTGVQNQQNKTDVWANNYSAVYHLNDPTNPLDSTINGKNGTNNGTSASPGKIAGAGDFDGSHDISLPANISLSSTLTYSTWAHFNATDNYYVLMGGWASNSDGMEIAVNAEPSLWAGAYDTRAVSGSSSISDTGWYHVTLTSNGTATEIYINGSLVGTAGTTSFASFTSALRIGSRNGSYYFKGTIDNAIVSSVARSADWIAAEYANQNSPETFASISKETGYYPVSDTSQWYSSEWSNRQKVTIDHTKVPNTDQTDFPVLIKITNQSNGVFASAQADGDDILFTSSNGTTKLSHEIETYTTTAGSKALWAWVKVPTLTTATDTVLYMYYGNAAATSQQNATDVWSNGYAGVWHLSESTSPANDSTTSNNDVSQVGGVSFSSAGKTANATSYDPALNQFLIRDSAVSDSTPLTLSAWFNESAGGSYSQTIVDIRNPGAYDYAIYLQSGRVQARTYGNAGDVAGNSGVYTTSQWNYATAVFNSTTSRIAYLNGVPGLESTSNSGTVSGLSKTSFGAYYTGTANKFAGSIDEVRISSTARSADWIATEYANQNSPETFESLSMEQSNTSYASPTSTTSGSGIIDTVWNGGWGTNGFSSAVTVPTNTSINFQMRSSAVGGSTDGDWTSWYDLGTATTTGTFAVTAANMPAGITTGTNRYIQTKALLASTDGSATPTLSDYTVSYLADTAAPTNPTISAATIGSRSFDCTQDDCNNIGWINDSGNITFTFSGASDGGAGESGITGYYVYFGTSDSADPLTAGAYQAHTGAVGDNQTYSSSISTSDDGKYYFLRIKTKDLAGNISNATTTFEFGYDITSPNRPSFISANPAGYTTTNSFDFTWPAADDVKTAGGWYNSSWSDRQLITFDHTKVPNTDQTDFPTLVKITDENNELFTTAKSNGYDILFTSQNGTTKLSHEIEKYDASTHELWAWVKLPLLSHETDTKIYMYYGNAAAANQQNATDVWSNGYAGVWHMGDNASNAVVNNSLGSSYTGTSQRNTSLISTNTKIGNGFEFNGSSDRVSIGNMGTSSKFTYEMWAKRGTVPWPYRTLFSTQTSFKNLLWEWDDNGRVGFGDADATNGVASWDYPWADKNEYHHLAVVVPQAGGAQPSTLYFDGESKGEKPAHSTDDWGNVVIGAWQNGTGAFPGFIDEVRVSFDAARSADWIATEYANQNSPETFMTVSASNGGSDIKWYEYKRATDEAWSHTADTNTRTVSGLTAYQEGANAFYVRSVDNAGNISSNYQQVTYYYSGVAPDKPTNLSVSPDTSDSNSFTISWDKPAVDPEDPPVKGYRYSINAAPTMNNTTYVENSSDTVTIGPDAFATLQGTNTIYVLSVNEAGNYSLEDAFIASKTFTCQTPAQPAPVQVSLTDSSDSNLSRWMLTLQWAAGSGQTDAFDHYVIYRSTDGQGFSELATTSSTAYIDASSLNNQTTYYYNIKAVDSAGKQSAQSTTVSKTPTGKYLTPPSYLNTPVISNIKSSSSTISWITDRSSTSIVRYGKSTNDLDASSGQMDSVTSHEVELTGLDAGSTYYFQVQSLDEHRDYSPSLAYSTSYSFQTSDAPTISNVEVGNITLTSADISWETTTVSNSSLYYGENSSFASKVDDVSGSSATKHSVKLSDLTHSTKYAFKITATDIEGNELVSDNYNFETLPMPRVENLKTTLIQDKARPGAKITWNTNVDTSSIVKYSVDGKDPKEETKSKLQKDHEVIIENLQDQANYKIEVSGRDSLGNLAQSTTATLITPNDQRPPVILEVSIETSNVGLNKEDKAQAVISWATDEPATSRVEYGVGLGGENYEKMTSEDTNLSTSHVVIISDLDPSSPYHIRINSKDGSGNLASSEDQAIISSEVQKSTLRILLDALTKAFSWIKL